MNSLQTNLAEGLEGELHERIGDTLWRFTNILAKVQNGALRNVKNEGTSGDVYENKASTTKCHAKNAAFYTKIHRMSNG
jgi:hypothetical protein